LPFYQLGRKAFYKYVVGGYDYLNVEKTMKETFLKVISEDISHHLPFIKVPTVIIWGDKDSLTPIAHGEILSKKVENSKFIIVRGAKHALQIENPEVLAGHIISNL
jgi:pimeloyl-ACP methyl ester carboxylesterase